MNKIPIIFVVILSWSLVVSSSIFARPSPQSYLNEDEIKVLHEQTYSLVVNGKEGLVDSQPLVKKYKDIFEHNPELYLEYLSKLDVNDANKIREKLADESSITFTSKGDRVIKMDDGSFIVEHSSLKNSKGIEVKSEGNSDSFKLFDVHQDTGWQSYTANSSGESFTNDARQDYWGLWKTQELHLVTKYKVYTSTIEITSTSTAGTSAWFPGKVDEKSSKINKNNAKEVESMGEYTIAGVVKEITYSKDITITTNIKINNASGGKINFSVRSIVEGP